MTTHPLISCILPTANRRAFVPQAIRYFLSQDYANRELLIVDDGDDSVADLVPDDPQVRYLRLSGTRTLGTKRNLCVEAAHGDLIMHWDDDDWHAPHRISYQVAALMKAEAEVCGLRRMLWYDVATDQAWMYQYPDYRQPWLAGNSLLYTRAFWRRSPFPDLQVGSDTRFIFSQPLDRSVALLDCTFYVGMIHPKNTSPKPLRPPFWSRWDGDLRTIMGADLDFYQQTSHQLPAGPPAPTVQAEQREGNHLGADRKAATAMSAYPPVSVCLLSYRRPQHMQPIVDSLHEYPFVDEILVWNNNPQVKLALRGSKVRVIDSPENMLCYGRFLCAQAARNQVIYMQDDDAIIRNVPLLYRTFLADDTRVTHALSTQHYAQRDRTHYANCHLALLGWGSFLYKEWLEVLDHYLASDGDNPLLRREADKLFVLLLGRKHTTVLADMQLLEHHATPGIALYLQDEHQLMVALAIRRALALLRESKAVRFPVTWNVVITCHNYGRYLTDAVSSVLLNDADYVITIVDDASSDETAQISSNLCQKYPWIGYIRHEENTGAGHARNSGIAAVDSIFTICLDADDKIGPDYLFEAERLLRSGCDVANPDAILFGNFNSRWPVPDAVSLPMLLERNPVHCSSAFRRSFWAQVGGFDENMSAWEDYEFWIRFAAAGARIRRVSGDHFYYRQHGTSRSSEAAAIEDVLRTSIRRKHGDLYAQHHMKG